MSESDYSEQFAQCLARFAFHIVKASGLKTYLEEDEPILKEKGGFFGSFEYMDLPRYLVFAVNSSDPNYSVYTGRTVERKLKAFIATINRDYCGDQPLEVNFEKDPDGKLRQIYVKVEPLIENPVALARLVGMLDRRHFIEGGATALAGVALHSFSGESKDRGVRVIGKGAGIAIGLVGLASAIKPSPKLPPNREDFVSKLKEHLDKNMNLGG